MGRLSPSLRRERDGRHRIILPGRAVGVSHQLYESETEVRFLPVRNGRDRLVVGYRR
jgi:hypothetical protein